MIVNEAKNCVSLFNLDLNRSILTGFSLYFAWLMSHTVSVTH